MAFSQVGQPPCQSSGRQVTRCDKKKSQRCEYVRDLAVEGMLLGSEELVEVLARHKGMTALHLGLNSLTEKGMQAVGMWLRVHRDLEYIDVWGNPGLGTPGAFALLGPLTYSSIKLRTLNLSQCGLGAGVVPGLLSLSSKGSLRALSVANNALGPEAGRQLAELLRCGTVALDFSDCALGHRGIAPLAKLLRDSGPCSCCLLGLSWNSLGPAGLEEILSGGANHVSSGGNLCELYLRGNGTVSLPAAQYARHLAAAGTTFERLDLSRNGVSPEADQCLRLPVVLEKMKLPERVVTEADKDIEDDAVYLRRGIAPRFQSQPSHLALQDLTPPPRLQLDLARMPGKRRTAVPGQLLNNHQGLVEISPNAPVRNRRNEAEAFEAYIVKRSRFASPRRVAHHLELQLSPIRGQGAPHHGGEWQQPARFPRGSKLKGGLMTMKRPTTR